MCRVGRRSELGTSTSKVLLVEKPPPFHKKVKDRMADMRIELNELFTIPPVIELPPDVSGELQSILRLHSMTPQDLHFNWEAYTLKMGTEQTKLDLNTARAFKKDLQEDLERKSRGKAHVRSVDKRGAYATPRAGRADDVFGM